VVDVGRGRDDEGYSGFEGSELAQILREHDVDDVYVCGLATTTACAPPRSTHAGRASR
jgi:nicotinamidase-related amidase